jgi:hypothetical protein
VFDPLEDEGDVTYDEVRMRGQAAYAEEHRELGQILRNSKIGQLSEEEIDDVVEILTDSKQDQPQTEAGRLVEMAERTGYVHSAINAFKVAIGKEAFATRPSDNQTTMLYWMAENVFSNHIIRLIELSVISPAVRQFLLLRSEDITVIFSHLQHPTIHSQVFKLYEAEGKEDVMVRLQLFYDSLNAWKKFGVMPKSNLPSTD